MRTALFLLALVAVITGTPVAFQAHAQNDQNTGTGQSNGGQASASEPAKANQSQAIDGATADSEENSATDVPSTQANALPGNIRSKAGEKQSAPVEAEGWFSGSNLWLMLAGLALVIVAVATAIMMRARAARRWKEAARAKEATDFGLAHQDKQIVVIKELLTKIQETLSEHGRRIARLDEENNALSSSLAMKAPQPAPPTHREIYEAPFVEPVPVAGPSPRSRELVEAMVPVLAVPARRRMFGELLDQFGAVNSVTLPGNEIVLAALDDAEAYLVAVPDGNEYLVIPGFEYATNFDIQFNAAAQSPDVVTRLFKLQADGTGQLALVEPARIRVDHSGLVEVVSRGELRGYTI